MYTVYLVTNNLSKKMYVGVTKRTLQQRWTNHCSQGYYLTSAIKKYGKDNFTIETLSTCTTKEIACKYEILAINKLKTKSPNGYNFSDGGQAPTHTKEICQKISKSSMGKKLSEKHLEAIRKSSKINAEKRRGIKRPEFSLEWKQNISKAKLGKKLSEETKLKIKIALANSEKFKNAKKGEYFKTNNPNKNPMLREKIARSKWKPVYCINTDISFLSIKHASEFYNIKGTQLATALHRGTKVNNLKFEYITK